MELLLMIPAGIALFAGVILAAALWELFIYAAFILGILYFVAQAIMGLF